MQCAFAANPVAVFLSPFITRHFGQIMFTRKFFRFHTSATPL
jgi:hypothetical protein